MPGNLHLPAGFNRPYRERERHLRHRLFAGKRSRLDRLGWPGRFVLSYRPTSRLFNLLAFWEAQGRLPDFGRTGYLNDYLFEIKSSGENLELRRRTSDKAEMKSYLAEALGADHAIPTLAVLDSPQAVDAFDFPADAIVKPTHMSGVIYRCGDTRPSAADRARMRSWFDVDYGRISNETNYRGLRPRILVEPFLQFNGGYSNDVRIFVFGGEVTIIEVVSGRYHQPTIDFFDAGWNRLTGWRKNGCGHSPDPVERPKRLDEMVAIARRVGRDFSFIRVDFLTDFAERFHVCELTHVSGNCRDRIEPPEADRYYVTGHPGAACGSGMADITGKGRQA